MVITNTRDFITQVRNLYEKGKIRLLGQSVTPLLAGKPDALFSDNSPEPVQSPETNIRQKLLTEVTVHGEGSGTNYTIIIRVITPAEKEPAGSSFINSRTSAVFIFRLKADETAVFSLPPIAEENGANKLEAGRSAHRIFIAIRVRQFYGAPERLV